MTNVTVPGADGSTFTMNFGDAFQHYDTQAAQDAAIFTLDLDAAPADEVNVADISDQTATVPGAYNELTDSSAGSYTVGAAGATSPPMCPT